MTKTELPMLNHVLKKDDGTTPTAPACWRCGKNNSPYCTWKSQGSRVICKSCHIPSDNEIN